MLKLKVLNGKRCFALLLCFSLVCGCCPAFFSAKAATYINETLPADKAWYLKQDGSIVNATTNQRVAVFNVEGGQTVTITRSGSIGGGTAWWEISCFTQEPYIGITGGHYLLRVTGTGDNPVTVTPPEGYDWLAVCPVINATSSTNVSVTVEYETTVVPDVPSYDGTTSGSSSVITGIQQGYEFDGVRIDTATSQLTASLVEETALPMDSDEDGVAESYVLKSTYKVPVLVSCVITNTSSDYAWLNDKTIGYTPTFTSSIPLLADAATNYQLSDIYYTSAGFADAVTVDGTVHFRFHDSNYYLGNVIIKPMSTLSASALLYYDITVIMTVPVNDGSYYSYLTSVAQIMRTTIIQGVSLSGINAVQGMLSYIPTDSTSMGQQQINNSVVQQGQLTQQAVQALQNQQQMQYNDFINPSPDAGNEMVNGGIGSVNEKLGIFTAVEGILQNTLGLFSEENVGDTKLVFPAFGMEIQGERYQFWEDTEYDLSSLEEPFGVLLSAVRLGTALVVYGALLMYLQKVFAEIIGGSDE